MSPLPPPHPRPPGVNPRSTDTPPRELTAARNTGSRGSCSGQAPASFVLDGPIGHFPDTSLRALRCLISLV